jgi:NADH-quinone oxidoreductase subunit L
VRPALAVAGWCKAFDTYVIDGVIHLSAWVTVWVSRFSGLTDNRVVDGLVNWVSRVSYRTGTYLRNLQTGSLRSYVLFLVLAAVAIWVVLSLLAIPVPAAR